MTKKNKRKKTHVQFSKIVTAVFGGVMLPISVYVIYKCLALAELAINNAFTGALPYVTAIVGFVEASVTVVLGFYFDNSKKEKVARVRYSQKTYAAFDNLNRDF